MNSVTKKLNWATEISTYSTSEKKEIKSHVSEREKELRNKGWRWITIKRYGTKTQILVPCNKDGSPTSEGEEKIRKFTEDVLNIVNV